MIAVLIHCGSIFPHIVLRIVQLSIGQAALGLPDPAHHRDDLDRLDVVLVNSFSKKKALF